MGIAGQAHVFIYNFFFPGIKNKTVENIILNNQWAEKSSWRHSSFKIIWLPWPHPRCRCATIKSYLLSLLSRRSEILWCFCKVLHGKKYYAFLFSQFARMRITFTIQIFKCKSEHINTRLNHNLSLQWDANTCFYSSQNFAAHISKQPNKRFFFPSCSLVALDSALEFF